MDREKRLLVRSALAEPQLAAAAWQEWRQDFAGPSASSALVWAGGYIYKNLKAAGVIDPYVKGIHRHNWLSNTAKKSRLLPVLRELSKISELTPIKSFAFNHGSYSLGFRPIADFDIYFPPQSIEPVTRALVNLGFSPLMGVSLPTLLEKIYLQRGSWNFLDAQGNDIDLHWKTFDFLSLEENHRLAKANSVKESTEIGMIRRQTPEFMFASQIYVHSLQGEARFNGLFDLYGLLESLELKKTAEKIAELELYWQARKILDELSEALELKPENPLRQLRSAISFRPRMPKSSPKIASQRLAQIPKSSLRYPSIYRKWFVADALPTVERIINLIKGPATSPSLSVPVNGATELKFAEHADFVPVGFHYQYPEDNFRWAHKGDARVRFDIMGVRKSRAWESKRLARVIVHLDSATWKKTPTSRVNVYCNGQKVGRFTKRSTSLEFTARSHNSSLEISLRSNQMHHPLEDGIYFNWFQMLCPISSIEVYPFSHQKDSTVARENIEIDQSKLDRAPMA